MMTLDIASEGLPSPGYRRAVGRQPKAGRARAVEENEELICLAAFISLHRGTPATETEGRVTNSCALNLTPGIRLSNAYGHLGRYKVGSRFFN